MANEIGFSLEIPDTLLKDMESVDTGLENIAKQAKTTADIFNGQMAKMSSGNITSLLQQLTKAKDALGALGSADKAVSGIVQLGNSSEQATDTLVKMNTIISQLADALNKLNAPRETIPTGVPNSQGIDDISRFKAELIGLKQAFQQDGNIDSYIVKLQALQQQYPNVAVQANILGTSLGKLNAISKDVKDALVIGDTPTLIKESEVTQAISLLKTLKSTAEEGTEDFNKYQKSIAQYTAQLKAMRKVQSEPIDATGALAMSNEAKSIAERTEAIKQLKIARDNLDTTDKKNEKTLDELNGAIKKNTDLNKQATQATDQLRKSQSKAFNITQQLTRQASLYFSVSQVQGYIKKLAEVRGEFELQQKSLQAIMQDKYQADKVWGQIVDLSVRSPFRLKELTTYTKQLAAYRVENEKIFDTTKMLADVSAGLGVDMSRLILAYGQVKAANYLRGTELRQFSEAGINILGELSAYFTELEGRAISTADVFEMVSKRMVSFEDVNKVFKDLTSEGGIFYNMQEIQAETLIGKISNLGDAFDIMLNKIGTTNEDAIKGGIDAVRYLLENYEILVSVLKAVAAALVLVGVNSLKTRQSLLNYAVAQNVVADGAKRLSSIQLLKVAFEKVALGFRALTKAFASNVWLVAIYAIISGVRELVNWNKELNESLDEINKKYNKQTSELYKIERAFNDITKSAKKATAADEEFSKSTYDKKKVELLKLAKLIEDRNFTTVIDVELATEDNINELFTQGVEILQFANDFGKEFASEFAKGLAGKEGRILGVNLFGDNLERDINQAIAAWDAFGGAAKSQIQEIEEKFDALAKNGELPEAAKEYYDQLKAGQKENEKDYTWLLRRVELLNKINLSGLDPEGYIGKSRDAMDDLVISSQELFELEKNRSKVLRTQTELAFEIQKRTEKLLESYGKASFEELSPREQEAVQIEIKTFLDEKIASEQVRDFVSAMTLEDLKIQISITPELPSAELSHLQEIINEYIEENELDVKYGLKLLSSGDDPEEFFKGVNTELKLSVNETKQLSQATEQLNESLSNTESAKVIEKKTGDLTELLKAFGRYEDKVKSSSKSENQLSKKIKDQISLIKKMNSEYEKLRDNFSDEEALSRVMDSFSKSMDDLDLTEFMRGRGLSDLDLADAFSSDTLVEAARIAGKEASDALNEAFGESKVELDIDMQIGKLDSLSDEFERMFDEYDLTLQLEGFGFTAEQAGDLFSFDYVSLDELRKKIEENRDALFGLGKEGEDAYRDAMGRITDLAVKAQKERNEKVYEILKQSYTEREQLERDYQQDLSDIQSSTVDDAAKARAARNVTAQYELDVAELDYKDFKLTDEYLKAFEDLDNFGTATIEHLLFEFERFAKTPNLSTETVKILTDKIQELYDESISRNPFEALRDSLKDYAKATEEAKRAQIDLDDTVARVNLPSLESEVATARTDYSSAEEDLLGIDPADFAAYEQANNRVTESLLALQEAERNLVKGEEEVSAARKRSSDAADAQAKALRDAQEAVKSAEDGYVAFSDVVNEAIQMLKDLADGLGIALDPETEAILDGISKGIGIVASALGIVLTVIIAITVASAAMMAVLWPLLAIGAALGAVFAIVGASEAKREKIIEQETRNVERLQVAYDKLYASFENSYTTSGLEHTTQAMLNNIQQQISALERARAAEIDKKKTDQSAIDDYNDQIYDLREQAIEAQYELTRELGGIGSDEYKSAAQSFVEAWESAFFETGDGLSGLEEEFDEMLKNIVQKQAISRAMDTFMKPLYESIDAAVQGGVTEEEMQKLMKEAEEIMPDLSEFLENLYKSFGFEYDQTSGELSALQQGIQAITEPQAAAIEAYLNSIRFEVNRQGEVMGAMLLALQSVGNLNNPDGSIIYQELVRQTTLLKSIDTRLGDVIKQGGSNGAYIQTNL